MNLKRKSTWFYLIATGSALVASLMAVSFISAAKQETKIVVTTNSLKAYQQITKDDLKLVSVPSLGVQSDTFKLVEEAIGQYTSMSVEPNSPLRQGEIVTGAERPAGVLAKMDNSSHLVMVSVPLQKNDLGNGIMPGDHINIVGLMKDQQNIKVIKVLDRPVVKIEEQPKSTNSSGGPSLWVVIPDDQTTELQKAITNGNIRVELLPKGEGSK